MGSGGVCGRGEGRGGFCLVCIYHNQKMHVYLIYFYLFLPIMLFLHLFLFIQYFSFVVFSSVLSLVPFSYIFFFPFIFYTFSCLTNGVSPTLFHLFSSFHTNIAIFTTTKYGEMLIPYMVLGLEPMTFRI